MCIYILPFVTNKDDYSNKHPFIINVKTANDFLWFLKYYTIFIFKNLKDDYQQLNEIIENILFDLNCSTEVIPLLESDKKRGMQIGIALVLREIFRNFPIRKSNYFKSINKAYFFPENKMSIQSDYFLFCVNDVTKKRDYIEKQKIEINSLYALSVVSEPDVFDGESMCNLLKSFLIENENEDENEDENDENENDENENDENENDENENTEEYENDDDENEEEEDDDDENEEEDDYEEKGEKDDNYSEEEYDDENENKEGENVEDDE